MGYNQIATNIKLFKRKIRTIIYNFQILEWRDKLNFAHNPFQIYLMVHIAFKFCVTIYHHYSIPSCVATIASLLNSVFHPASFSMLDACELLLLSIFF